MVQSFVTFSRTSQNQPTNPTPLPVSPPSEHSRIERPHFRSKIQHGVLLRAAHLSEPTLVERKRFQSLCLCLSPANGASLSVSEFCQHTKHTERERERVPSTRKANWGEYDAELFESN